SLKLNLNRVYQLTHRMMICPSKCRPLNNASIGTNRCILSSSPDRTLFAPEPSCLPSTLGNLQLAGSVARARCSLRCEAAPAPDEPGALGGMRAPRSGGADDRIAASRGAVQWLFCSHTACTRW